MFLLDTCALVWWTLDPERLSKRAATACRAIEPEGKALISSISIWEIGIKIKGGKLDIGMSIEGYHRLLKEMSTLEIVPVDALTWVKSLSLEWDNRDPADRAIVALGLLRDLKIITSDLRIRRFYPGCIW